MPAALAIAAARPITPVSLPPLTPSGLLGAGITVKIELHVRHVRLADGRGDNAQYSCRSHSPLAENASQVGMSMRTSHEHQVSDIVAGDIVDKSSRPVVNRKPSRRLTIFPMYIRSLVSPSRQIPN
jgi:hypothetical protein